MSRQGQLIAADINWLVFRRGNFRSSLSAFIAENEIREARIVPCNVRRQRQIGRQQKARPQLHAFQPLAAGIAQLRLTILRCRH